MSRTPLCDAFFQAIPDGAAHRARLEVIDREWVSRVRSPDALQSVGPTADPSLHKAGPCDVDVLYAGGTLSLPHAILLARLGWNVMVFDRWKVGFVRREWNVGREEFDQLHTSGLLSPDVAETMALRRYTSGFVQWHQGRRLDVTGVLDVPIDAPHLMSTLRQELIEAGGEVRDHLTLTAYNAASDGVCVRLQPAQGPVVTIKARLLVLATGASARSDFDLICPTVGTVARGFAQGSGRDEVDPNIGELLVSTEGVSQGRQLIWELFPGRGDEVATYLFYYHEPRPDYPGRLLELFERYLEKLPTYKRGTLHGSNSAAVFDGIEHVRPVYGLIPAHTRLLHRDVSPHNRVLSYGDAAAQQSPLIFTGFGSALRHLPRMVDMVHNALLEDDLSQPTLNLIRAGQTNTNLSGRLTLMMTVRNGRPIPKPDAINTLLDAAFASLWKQGDDAVRAFIQDRYTWSSFHAFMWGTMKEYPQVFDHVFSTLSPKENMQFIQDYAAFAALSGVQSTAGSALSALSSRLPFRARLKLSALQRTLG